jgi:dTDP-4-amino-4,6-dideoxygalactose transaminase
MDRIGDVARRHGLAVVEDNAHGLFGRHKGKSLGSFGDLAALSFHETKNLICGEGGAIIVNNQTLIERAEILREKGTNRSRFLRGQVDKYTWVDVGSSYLMSDILAAFLLAQLEKADEITAKRRRVWEYYRQHLSDWAKQRGVRLPCVPPHCEQPYHMFYLILPSLEIRQRMIGELRARGILSVFHYVPLHTSPMGVAAGGRAGQCPVSEIVSERLLRLPFYNDLSEADQAEIVDVIQRFDDWS